MDKSEITKSLAELAKNTAALNRLLAEIGKLDIDRARNIASLQARISKLDACVDALRQMPDVIKQIEEWLVVFRSELLMFKEEQVKRFGVALESELRKQGLELSGHYPDLHAGVFTIEMNRDKWQITLWYGPKQERLGTCAMLAEETAELVEKSCTTLGSHVEEAVFVQRLQESLARLRQQNEEGVIPIIAVLQQLALMMQSEQFRRDPKREHYNSYGRADFSMDLFRFGRRVQLRTAARALTRSRDDFLWVPSDERSGDGAVYSHVCLRKEIL